MFVNFPRTIKTGPLPELAIEFSPGRQDALEDETKNV